MAGEALPRWRRLQSVAVTAMNAVPLPDGCFGAAVFSSCGRYRYALARCWSDQPGRIVWIMLNPSRAGATRDDPTIRRCTAFSRSWGYGGMTVVNLYALCTADPDQLQHAEDPVGPENDIHVARTCAWSLSATAGRRDVIAAWGAHPLAAARAGLVLSIAGLRVDCLGMTLAGHPRHPLYVPSSQPRLAFLGMRAAPGSAIVSGVIE